MTWKRNLFIGWLTRITELGPRPMLWTTIRQRTLEACKEKGL